MEKQEQKKESNANQFHYGNSFILALHYSLECSTHNNCAIHAWNSYNYIQTTQTSTGKEVDDVLRRFHGQMMEETSYDNREEEVTGKKVSKGDYKRYQDIVALGAALWKSGKRKVKATVETLYSRIN